MADQEGDAVVSADSPEAVVQQLKEQALFHTLICATLLVVMLMAVCAFFVCLAGGINQVDVLLMGSKSEHRVEMFDKRIDQALKASQQQYQEHSVKMQDKSLFAVSEKFKIIYALSIESEQDNSQFLLDYQQIVYQIASNTRGSGEWHQFHNEKLTRFVNKNKYRVNDLRRYVHKEDEQ